MMINIFKLVYGASCGMYYNFHALVYVDVSFIVNKFGYDE